MMWCSVRRSAHAVVLSIGCVASTASCARDDVGTRRTSSAVDTDTLTTPDAAAAADWSDIRSIRELADGRLLALDYEERALRLVDFGRDSVRQVGRVGNGPGEYQLPRAILAAAGDSSILVDAMPSRELAYVRADGSMHRLVLDDSAAREPTRLETVHVETDAAGRVYTSRAWMALQNGRRVLRSDSGFIERLDPATRARDTLALVSTRRVPADWDGSPPGDGGDFRARPAPFPPTPFAMRDEWTILPDGTVAVVTVRPFGVRFVRGGKSTPASDSLPWTPMPVADGDRAAWRDDQLRPQRSILFTSEGIRASSFTLPSAEPSHWPETLPPFLPSGVRAAPDGSVWIQRAMPVDSAPEILVVDGSGHLRRRMRLPLRARVVGFGVGRVYVARRDERDLERLDRYRLRE